MILDIYRDLFQRIYIFSPSITIDTTWLPVKRYIEKEMGVDTEKEQVYFDEYKPEDLHKIIDTQNKVVEYQKQKNNHTFFQILIVVDDFADSQEFSRQSKLLHSLFTRGRHSSISTIVATQKFNALHPIIRVNASSLYVFRLRNFSDLAVFLDEISALVGDKQTLLEIY